MRKMSNCQLSIVTKQLCGLLNLLNETCLLMLQTAPRPIIPKFVMFMTLIRLAKDILV